MVMATPGRRRMEPMLKQMAAWTGGNVLGRSRTDLNSGLPVRDPRVEFFTAAALVCLGILAHLVLPESVADHLAYLTFYPAVAVAALLQGLRSAILAMIMSCLAIVLWLSPLANTSQWLELAVFVTSCFIIGAGAEAMHRAQARAMQVEERLELALDAGKIGLFEHDHLRERYYWSPVFREILGVGDTSTVSLDVFFTLLHPEERAAVKADVRKAHDPAGDGIYAVEHRVLRGDGEVRWLNCRSRTFFTGEGSGRRPERTIGVAVDITARKRAEIELTASQARLTAMLENAEDAIISVNGHQDITLFNRGAEVVFGYTSAEVIGKPLTMLIPRRYAVAHRSHVIAFGRGDTAARRMGNRNSIVGLRKNGEEFPAEATILKLGGLYDPVYTTILRDTTESKRVEQELERHVMERTRELEQEMQRRQEAQEALARMQRMEALGNLTGGIAHDFNNLLTVIAGNHQLIEMEVEDERARRFLSEAERAVEMGARLNQRLMTFARQRKLAPAAVDLNETIIGMRDLLRRSIGEHIIVRTELSANLWPAKVDPTEVENALLNLAINARDAMPEGGNLLIETCNATIGLEQAITTGMDEGDYTCLSVSDTGYGMDPEVAARAFEPFFTTKEKGKGTGLGLATIYGFVKQSSGHVTLRSEKGEGTTISIFLPRHVAAEEVPMVRVETAVARGQGEAILLVEDHPEVRRVTVARLAAIGYKVNDVASGAAAIAMLENGPAPDLLFSDIVMPGGMSGYDLARIVGRRWPELKILLTSAHADAALAGEEGLNHIRVLQKPYKLSTLAAAIREALGSDNAVAGE